jgi:hypothetical protein
VSVSYHMGSWRHTLSWLAYACGSGSMLTLVWRGTWSPTRASQTFSMGDLVVHSALQTCSAGDLVVCLAGLLGGGLGRPLHLADFLVGGLGRPLHLIDLLGGGLGRMGRY